LSEARFYLAVLQLSSASTAADVSEPEESLTSCLKDILEQLGGGSMLVRLALGAHSKLVGAALDREFALGEALFKQHIRLQVGRGGGLGEGVGWERGWVGRDGVGWGWVGSG
jgi:hypothetical protein